MKFKIYSFVYDSESSITELCLIYIYRCRYEYKSINRTVLNAFSSFSYFPDVLKPLYGQNLQGVYVHTVFTQENTSDVGVSEKLNEPRENTIH